MLFLFRAFVSPFFMALSGCAVLSLLKAFGFLLGAWPLVPYLAADVYPGSGGALVGVLATDEGVFHSGQ